MAAVVELRCYPIKGCAGTSLRDAVLTPAGIAGDRGFMVVGVDGVFRSQRQTPRLAVVRPELGVGGVNGTDGADGELLTLRADAAGALVVRTELDGPRVDVTLFGAPYRAIDQGDEAAAWLTEVLGEPSRLVRVPPEHDRLTDGVTPGTSGFADSSAVLVTSLSSLAALNERITARGAQPVPMERFRPNIVVDGWDEPHTEDLARTLAIGDAELGFAKPAIRCVVTTVDQRTGARAGPEPLRTLASYRRAPEGGVAFGAKFAVPRPGKLSVGDEVVLTPRS